MARRRSYRGMGAAIDPNTCCPPTPQYPPHRYPPRFPPDGGGRTPPGWSPPGGGPPNWTAPPNGGGRQPKRYYMTPVPAPRPPDSSAPGPGWTQPAGPGNITALPPPSSTNPGVGGCGGGVGAVKVRGMSSRGVKKALKGRGTSHTARRAKRAANARNNLTFRR